MTIADHPGPTSRPVPQWTRPGETPWRPSAARATTTDAGSVGLNVAAPGQTSPRRMARPRRPRV